jgi:hypothetical protein
MRLLGAGMKFRGKRNGHTLGATTPLAKRKALRHKNLLPARRQLECGCSSGVEHNLAKVGVEGSNPFARSNFCPNRACVSNHRDIRLLLVQFSMSAGSAVA